jgi:hypothetical protein
MTSMTTTVYVVTPCMNAVETIDRTIMSVVTQAGDFRIRYHIQDGGSTDGTLDRIEAWKERLRSGSFPRQCHGIRFTSVSEQETGMYDALVRGFSSLNPSADDFMTWINADDVLMTGSLALAATLRQQFTAAQLSWFGGSVCNIKDDTITASLDLPIPRDAIRKGLCDGVHWNFLQQAGTFFRKWMWEATKPSEAIACMKLAGDWNLWRLMAEKASFVQVGFPLGAEQNSAGQVSIRQLGAYLAEIDSLIPLQKRKLALEEYLSTAPVTRRRIQSTAASSFCVVEESVDYLAQDRYRAVFGSTAPWAGREQPIEKKVAKGKIVPSSRDSWNNLGDADISKFVRTRPAIIAFDADWQFPAVTEQHAFCSVSSVSGGDPSSFVYVAFPWATLIDKIQRKSSDADMHLDRFEKFIAFLPRAVRKVTVCQHIHGKQFIELFRQAGIDDVFWSHATHEDAAAAETGLPTPRFWPFPLFPVQVKQAIPEAGPDGDILSRPFLFSFIGARANKHYLTEARNWILDLLKDDPRGLIIGRDTWHYQKVVYDLQVKGTSSKVDEKSLVDSSASDEFRASLLQSTFSLCPAGSGPNSIRLWESLGAGSIPVILADTWAPPGDRRLWDMAAVFCKETPEDIKALPDRLAALAADPGRLAQMRHAMRQLWLLYGPDSFVTDVQQFMLEHSAAPVAAPAGEDALGAALVRGDARDLLQSCTSGLLLDPATTLGRIAADRQLSEALRKARADLPADAPLARHYDAVCAHATRTATPRLPLAAPTTGRGAAPKLCFLGRHSNRTPLSYAPIRRLVGERIETVERPEQADLIVTGFNIDLRENAETLQPLLKSANRPKIAILSEEPLWDITWSGPFTGREGKLSVKNLTIPYTFLSHETSAIYDFERIPYFVLTSESYAVRYANMMARFAKVSSASLLERWSRAQVKAAFFAEHRKGEAYARSFPERDVAALSAYRTEVAESAKGDGVLRVGKGWGEDKPRQDLPDWHLDKLAQLDGRTKVLSAIENVHQRLYISEKIFDAFAVGAIPAYWAGPKHRIFDLVPEKSMLNLHGLDAQAAADRIASIAPDAAFADAWLATCARLSQLFGNIPAIQRERRRVAEAALGAVLEVV